MSNNQIRVLALIAAANARVAGMTAENQMRLSNGNSIAYDEGHFFSEANELEALAKDVMNS